MKVNERLHMPLTLGAFGLVFFTVGLYAVHDGWHTDVDLADSLRDVPVVDARGLATQTAGATVLIEGRIAVHQPVVEAGLSLLQRQQAVGVTKPGTNEIRFTWEPVPARPSSDSTQPLAIDGGGGTVTLVNTDFSWRDPPRVETQPATVVAGSTRLVGFAAGDAITLRATVVDGAQARVRAIEVFGGTHAAYRRSLAASAAVPYVLGGGFALAGVGMLVAAGLGWRRGRRALPAS
jgi:hypothetical protein